MPSTTTPNMALTLPTVGTQLAPTWADNINSDFLLLDQHNHTPGSGVPITPAGLDISSDLTFQSHNGIGLRSLRLVTQTSPLSLPTDKTCVYTSGADLYYNDSVGNQVRITQSGAVAGTPGSIANLVSPASATYVSATPAFVFQSGASISANIDGGAHVIRENILNAKGITLTSPASLANNYSLTMFTALPASNFPVLVNSSGNLTAALLTGTELVNSITLGGNPSVPGTLNAATLSVSGVSTLTGQVNFGANLNSTTASGTLKFNSGMSAESYNLAKAAVQLNNKLMLASNTVILDGISPTAMRMISATDGTVFTIPVTPSPVGGFCILIVRGRVSAAGTINSGEGFTITPLGSGAYTITFTSTFSSIPSVCITAEVNSVYFNINTVSASSCNVQANPNVNQPFSFIAIGGRPA